MSVQLIERQGVLWYRLPKWFFNQLRNLLNKLCDHSDTYVIDYQNEKLYLIWCMNCGALSIYPGESYEDENHFGQCHVQHFFWKKKDKNDFKMKRSNPHTGEAMRPGPDGVY